MRKRNEVEGLGKKRLEMGRSLGGVAQRVVVGVKARGNTGIETGIERKVKIVKVQIISINQIPPHIFLTISNTLNLLILPILHRILLSSNLKSPFDLFLLLL